MPPKRAAKASSTSKKTPAKKAKLSVEEDDEEIVPKLNSRSRGKVEEKLEENDKNSFGLSWEDVESDESSSTPMFCFYDKNAVGRKKCIGFDMDFTIIKPKSGAKFAKGASDWTWLYDHVPTKLKKLHDDGYRICIFSNQGGIEKNKVTVKEIMTKTLDIVKTLKFPVFAFYATGENHYRKPSTMMWRYFVDNCNVGVELDMNDSMYVGDAAGRAKNWSPGKPKDFSCTDRMFAANVGVKFQTPEEFFLNEKPAPFQWNSFDVEKYLSNQNSIDISKKDYHHEKQELVVFVGMPASGKSTFFRRYFHPHGYVHVNRDTLSTPAKCFKMTKDSLDLGKSVVVDNTNPTVSNRSEYIQLAKENKIPCRCVTFETPREIAHHLNYVRQNMTNGGVQRIPAVGYHVYAKNFQPPTTKEGFDEIIQIQFSPKFDDERHESLFKQWTA